MKTGRGVIRKLCTCICSGDAVLTLLTLHIRLSAPPARIALPSLRPAQY